MTLNRRTLLKQTLAAGMAAGSSPFFPAAAQSTTRKAPFTVDLCPGNIGIKADPGAVIALAHQYGFESVQPNADYLAKLDAVRLRELLAELAANKLVWGAAGLSVEFRGDEATFRGGMDGLPKLAAALQDAGAKRVGTWIKPYHESLTYSANFKQHAVRLREVARVLSDHGLRFGLEYVGTRTLWTKSRHSFIHTMAEARELIAEIGQPDLGLVLDSWHWFTAKETAEDILALKNHDVVACDLNDAPTGIAVEDQLDNQRELPASTGVIDIQAFLNALVGIGYDGPVRAEPFNKPLTAMEDGPAAEATAKSIRKAMKVAGV